MKHSDYKGHTILKCLIGVDPRGGVMFVSQLYGDSISDKEIVRRAGFWNFSSRSYKPLRSYLETLSWQMKVLISTKN